MPEAYQSGVKVMAAFTAKFKDKEIEFNEKFKYENDLLKKELSYECIRGEFFIEPNEPPQFELSPVLSIIFSNFKLSDIGVVDYHGAQRHYSRENIQGINLNLDSIEQQRSHSALYNYGSKYNNIKGEMASSYIKEMLIEQAGIPREKQLSLTNTLKELFTTFFPEKEFLGPQPTKKGSLIFPVKTKNGSVHDLDELSSGEKEILYGYLRIRNSAPKYSIILLDEPELHLNPRLIRSLPRFYNKHLGEDLDNQIWLVTHSDSLLREVVGVETYSVFHMVPCWSIGDDVGQIKKLSATKDLDLALVDMVGDLAAYRPGGKVIILEGGGDSDFDQKVISTLFPELFGHVNLISGSNKMRVRALHEILNKLSSNEALPFDFYCITDMDSERKIDKDSSKNIFTWDVYHIENYFLNTKYIKDALSILHLNEGYSEDFILSELRDCATKTIPELIRHELSCFVNEKILRCINLKVAPNTNDLASKLFAATSNSLDKIKSVTDNELSVSSLSEFENKLSEKYYGSLSDGSWVNIIRGRDVLKSFVGKHGGGVAYDVFRNVIIASMKNDSYRPFGMKEIINKIVNS